MRNKKSIYRVIDRIVRGMFAEELHHLQVMSVALVVLGVVMADKLTVSGVGAAQAKARGMKPKHAVKQVDRFMSNEKIRPVDLRGGFVRAAVGPRRRILVTMDWTDFDADDQTVLCLSLVTRSKRALPLVWTTERKSELKGRRGTHEKTALQMLRLALPVGAEVVVLADRGFGYTELFDHLLDIPGFRFVVRFRANIIVAAGATRDKARALVPGNGRVRVLGSAKLTAAGRGPYTVVLYKARGMKDSWCLATDLPTADGRDIVERYARRFECEEAFRDIKDRRYGLGLKYTSIDCPQRRERLLFAVAIAYFILTLAGVASERLGIDRILKANTVKRRTHSLFRQGREILGGELPHDYGAAFARLFRRLVTLAISGGFAHALA